MAPDFDEPLEEFKEHPAFELLASWIASFGFIQAGGEFGSTYSRRRKFVYQDRILPVVWDNIG